jgi:pimeloyl-ACP methyl ester carboxylesterase
MARLLPAVLDRAAALAGASGAPLRLVGWSLGGVLAREIALRRPALVDRVVTMGTPVVGGPKYTFAARRYRERGVDLDALAAAADARLRSRTLTRDVLAFYSRGDGIVEWRACIDPHNQRVEHVEVRSAHAGLGFHPEVYARTATFLAR